MQEEAVKNIMVGEEDNYVINVGPQHPSTHGVLRFVVSLKGEIVKYLIPHCGYIHRGHGKNVRKDHLSADHPSYRPDGLSFGPHEQ